MSARYGDLRGLQAPVDEARHLVEVDRQEAVALLASVRVGRVVFTRNALPAIRPVNHAVIDGRIVMRTRLSACVSSAAGEVVAYEADDLDTIRRLGWSVVVTGTARTIDDPDRIARYTPLVQPWADLPLDVLIGIDLQLVTGYRFVTRP
ncbi:pyridoxamine 5'-phosphate oxidase family protein [Kribbella sp. NPDC003505]|uniref:pyridoxamine 5'-phosphate oxidase family protein n=1 Tax=Kribbella sp. NPDC003505 TaxID=3154448 RepID=UPI0033B0FCCB